jgi:hypothetical protein
LLHATPKGSCRVRFDVGRPFHPAHLSKQRVNVVGDLHQWDPSNIIHGHEPDETLYTHLNFPQTSHKILLSIQLFLGVFASPGRDCLLTRKWDMDQSLKTAPISGFHQTEHTMTQIFGSKLGVPNLRYITATASKEPTFAVFYSTEGKVSGLPRSCG